MSDYARKLSFTRLLNKVTSNPDAKAWKHETEKIMCAQERLDGHEGGPYRHHQRPDRGRPTGNQGETVSFVNPLVMIHAARGRTHDEDFVPLDEEASSSVASNSSSDPSLESEEEPVVSLTYGRSADPSPRRFPRDKNASPERSLLVGRARQV
jgi:hypothetical protein